MADTVSRDAGRPSSGCGGRTCSTGVRGGIERALDGGQRSAKNRNRDRNQLYRLLRRAGMKG